MSPLGAAKSALQSSTEKATCCREPYAAIVVFPGVYE